MKRFGCVVVLLLLATPGWAARKISVGELTDMLKSMHQEKKSDTDVSSALKQLVLTEQLTRPVMNNLVEYVPGQLSTEQIYVLEARSAFLPPPAADLPGTAAPDAAAQKAILDKASNYVTSTYAQLPALAATKTTLRFQDNVEAVAPSSGMHSSASDVSVGSSFVSPFQYVHYINSTETNVFSEHGAEKAPVEKDKTPWGANRMIALQEPDPSVGAVFAEAQAAGVLQWVRWESINGRPAAVFSYSIPRKKSHLNLNVCCFPSLEQAGIARFSGQNGIGAPGGSAGAAGGATGNMQTNTDWHNFRISGVPYHGQFFVDPESGIIVRMITQAELKTSDVVHQQDTRIDYAATKVGDRELVLPARSVINSEVVPNGDSGAGRYATRCTLFTTEYKSYQPAAATAQK